MHRSSESQANDRSQKACFQRQQLNIVEKGDKCGANRNIYNQI